MASSGPAAPPRRKAVLAGIQHSYMPRTLALGYLKAYADSLPRLRSRWELSILDFSVERPWEEAADRLAAERPDLVGFSCAVWNMDHVLRTCRELRRRLPSVRLVLGGPEATPRAEELLKSEPSVDVVVRGEGEHTFAELLLGGGDGRGELAEVQGLAYREKGGVVLTPERPLLPDLSVLPSPYLTGALPMARGDRMVALETSRGCPFDCKFCDWQTKQRIRHFPVERVLREMAVIAGRGAHVYLADADLLIQPARAREVLRGFLGTPGDACLFLLTYLPALGKVDWLDELDSPRLWIAGGVQTTNDAVLKKIDRRFDRDGYEKILAELQRRAPRAYTKLQLIFGLAFDDIDGYRDSVDWALSRHPSDVDLFKALVLPGAGFGKDPESFGLRFRREPPYEVVETSTFPRERLEEAERQSCFLCCVKEIPAAAAGAGYLGEALRGTRPRPFLDVYDGLIQELLRTVPRLAELWGEFRELRHADRLTPFHDLLDLPFREQVLEGLRGFAERSLREAGRSDLFGELDRFLRAKTGLVRLQGRLAGPDAFELHPWLGALRAARRPLWIGWEGFRFELGTEGALEDRGSFVHLLSRVFSHGTKNLMFCRAEPRGVHLDVRGGPALLEGLRVFLRSRPPFDAAAVGGVYSRLGSEVRRELLRELRRAALPGAVLVCWDDLRGLSPIEGDTESLLRAARGEGGRTAPLAAGTVVRELGEAGWGGVREEERVLDFRVFAGAAPGGARRRAARGEGLASPRA